jgi:deoxyribodipyrimidine photolyase
LHDNTALQASLAEQSATQIVFVFDPQILSPLRKLPGPDARVQFIAESLAEISQELSKHGSSLIIEYGNPAEIIPHLMEKLGCRTLYYNRDYSPYPLERDAEVKRQVELRGNAVFSFKDHVMVEPKEIMTLAGSPFKKFTPFANSWKTQVLQSKIRHVQSSFAKLAKSPPLPRSSGEIMKQIQFHKVPVRGSNISVNLRPRSIVMTNCGISRISKTLLDCRSISVTAAYPFGRSYKQRLKTRAQAPKNGFRNSYGENFTSRLSIFFRM